MDARLTESLLESAALSAGRGVAPHVLDALPLPAYVDAAAEFDPYDHSEARPARQYAMLGAVAERFGTEAAVGMHRLGLVQLALRRVRSPELAQWPESVRLLTLAWLARLAEDVIEKPAAWFDPDGGDRLQLYGVVQDFAVAAGRALPAGGAWIIERRRMNDNLLFPSWQTPESRPGQAPSADLRSALLRMASGLRLRTPLRALRRRVAEARGRYADYYVIHTANRYRRHFTPRHLDTAYRNIALLLHANPDVTGIYRQNWFLDPAIANFDPRLAFLIDVPRRHGAIIRRLGPIGARRPAEIAAFSKARREQLEAGAYEPAEWAYLWPRERVLEWASAVPVELVPAPARARAVDGC